MTEREIYNEMDDFCAEILIGDALIQYVEAKRQYFSDPKGATEKYFSKNELDGDIATFGDFYYNYLAKFGNGYLYKFLEKGYTKAFRRLLMSNDINPDKYESIDWNGIHNKEEKYQEVLVDILFAMINYELRKEGLVLFGLNMGYESVIYFIVKEDAFKRIKKESDLFQIFDLDFLEVIYNEIFEVTGDLGVMNVEIGDFLEKRGGMFYSLFQKESENVMIKNIYEEDDSEVRLIL